MTPTLAVADTNAPYPGEVTYVDGPAPATARLDGGGSQEFVWHYDAKDFGEVTKDEVGMAAVKALGRRVAEVARLVHR